jgi:Kef-type K+ transport system membrane component KefB
VPAPVWALLLGVGAGIALPEFRGDEVIKQLGTLGVASLFLFAGLEVRTEDLRSDARALTVHVGTRVVTLALLAAGVFLASGYEPRAAILVALAVLTPSTGFILGAVKGMGLTDDERRSVRLKAIAAEILALAVLFFVLGSASMQELALSTAGIVGLAVAIPLLFRGAARYVLPHAPGSEFALVIIVALVAAHATDALGVHYFIGAFLVGVLVQRVRGDLPASSSSATMHAIELFSSFFMPYYFFSAGLALPVSALIPEAFLLGVALSAVALPARALIVTLQRKLTLRERWREGLRIAVPLLPTLIFALVIGEILHAQFGLPDVAYGALVVYAIVSTVVPSLVLGTPASRFDPAGAARDERT